MSRGWTQFPNDLLDQAMSQLRDTEWRLLCVIVRETIGRTDSEGRRQGSAWLSHRLLKQRTGRESAAISRAIDMLSQSRLIEVRDALGRQLPSRKLRRYHRGRLRFSLHPALQEQSRQKRSSKSEDE